MSSTERKKKRCIGTIKTKHNESKPKCLTFHEVFPFSFTVGFRWLCDTCNGCFLSIFISFYLFRGFRAISMEMRHLNAPRCFYFLLSLALFVPFVPKYYRSVVKATMENRNERERVTNRR